jgi:hypothetical protein
MKPDRSNYEIWLIDWLDGNLDQTQVELLMVFLDENPDIKEEADSLSVSQLHSPGSSFSGKQKLTRDISDLPPSQVEYLSVAYLEKEITNDQLEELTDNLDHNPGNREIFDTIQKLKLKPLSVRFRNRNLLKKEQAIAGIFSIPRVWISIAASVALLIIGYFLVPEFYNRGSSKTANNIISDTSGVVLNNEQPINRIAPLLTAVQLPEQTAKVSVVKPAPITTDTRILIAEQTEAASELNRDREPGYSVSRLKPVQLQGINNYIPEDSLIALNIDFTRPDFDDGRSRLEKFIARNFREKLLREESGNDSPLKSYEIAEAGVEGINKLLGWEMILVKNNDEDGDLKSLYFSSKVLKFNAPVKKEDSSL